MVDVLVVGDLPYPVGFRWDDCSDAPLIQFRPQPIDVERFVAQQGAEVIDGMEASAAEAVDGWFATSEG